MYTANKGRSVVDAFKCIPRDEQVRQGLTTTELARQLEEHCNALAANPHSISAVHAWEDFKFSFGLEKK